MLRLGRCASLVLLVLPLSGCTAALLDSFVANGNPVRMQRVVERPEMAAGVVTLVEGVAGELLPPERQRALVAQLVSTTVEELDKQIDLPTWDGVRAELTRTIDATLDAALAQGHRDDLSATAAQVTREVSRTLRQELSGLLRPEDITQVIDERIGPSMLRTLEAGTRASVRAALEEAQGISELSPALQKVASDVTRAMLQTISEELDKPDGIRRQLTDTGYQLRDLLFSALGGIVLPLGAIVWLVRRFRARTESLDLVTRAIADEQERDSGLDHLLTRISKLGQRMPVAHAELDRYLTAKQRAVRRRTRPEEPDQGGTGDAPS